MNDDNVIVIPARPDDRVLVAEAYQDDERRWATRVWTVPVVAWKLRHSNDRDHPWVYAEPILPFLHDPRASHLALLLPDGGVYDLGVYDLGAEDRDSLGLFGDRDSWLNHLKEEARRECAPQERPDEPPSEAGRLH